MVLSTRLLERVPSGILNANPGAGQPPKMTKRRLSAAWRTAKWVLVPVWAADPKMGSRLSLAAAPAINYV